ncbi:MAG: ankyrin repeat domain-containing protein [Chlamydiae bacterium]|nr:ankyrin repeat domain-containing protein [Chlamydiota bacterium]
MIITGGGSPPHEPDWRETLENLEREIETLRSNSSPDQTARIRSCVEESLKFLGKETLINPSSTDLKKRCSDLQSHLSKLEALCNEPKLFSVFTDDKIRLSRLFGSKTKGCIQTVSKKIEQIMKNFIQSKITDGISGADEALIKKEIEKIPDPYHMQIALACSMNGWFSGSQQDRINLLSQIRAMPVNQNLDYSTIESLLSLIPPETRNPQNMALFINATSYMTPAECKNFISDINKIDSKNRVYTLQSLVDYSKMTEKNPTNRKLDILWPTKLGQSGLHLAAGRAEIMQLEALLTRKDINVNLQDSNGKTPLFFAILSADKAIVETLLARNDIEVNRTDNEEQTPLVLAIRRGNKEIIEALLTRTDINVNRTDNEEQTPLVLAIRLGNKEIIEALLTRTDINVNLQNSNGLTPLHIAIQHGNIEIAKLLLQSKNIDVNLPEVEGKTALALAIELGNKDIVEALLTRKDINVNLLNSNGVPPLHLAIYYGNKEIVKTLLTRTDINVNLETTEGMTPLLQAAICYNEKLLELLIDHGANPIIRDSNGLTPYTNYKMLGLPIPSVLAPHHDELGYLLKMAALTWGINAVVSLEEDKPFNLEGGMIAVPLAKEIANFDFIPLMVRTAFSEVDIQRSAEEIAESIRKGNLTVIPAGFDEHAICLVFYQDMLFICNRGDGAPKDETLRCFHIDPKKATPETINDITSMYDEDRAKALEYYHILLPCSLASGRYWKEITDDFSPLQAKSQSVGNCSAASTKLAIRAALAALKYKEHEGHLSRQDIDDIRTTSKRATRELREISYQRLKKELENPKYEAIRPKILALFTEKRAKRAIEE